MTEPAAPQPVSATNPRLRVQLAWTALTEAIVMVSGLLILTLAAGMLGAEGFGEYALSRRAVNLLYLPLLLGVGIAAPRYIAIVRAGAFPGHMESSFVLATLVAGMVPAVLVAALLNAAPVLGASILFGDGSLAPLIPPATLAVVGLALHSAVYSAYRGQSRMTQANLLQFVNLGVVPVAAFLFAAEGAARVVLVTGAAWLSFATVAMVALILPFIRERAHLGMMRHLRVLLSYGVPRVPGEFALAGLFTIPALIAVRSHGVVAAGQFSAAMSILTTVAGVFAPVGLVLLPRVSAQVASGDLAGVRSLVLRILSGGILLAGTGVIAGEILLPFFVRWYFGEAFVPAVPVFRACLLGAIPYAAYVLMRNILDALDVKALNSRNLIISLAVLVLLCLIDSRIMWMSGSLVAALALLGALTLRDVYERLNSRAIAQPLRSIT